VTYASKNEFFDLLKKFLKKSVQEKSIPIPSEEAANVPGKMADIKKKEELPGE
jgi:hypothetical protein